VFLILTGLFYLIMTLVSLPGMVVAGRVLDPWVYSLIALIGVVLLINRSGISIKSNRRKRPQIKF
jgi:hypothetical protein